MNVFDGRYSDNEADNHVDASRRGVLGTFSAGRKRKKTIKISLHFKWHQIRTDLSEYTPRYVMSVWYDPLKSTTL